MCNRLENNSVTISDPSSSVGVEGVFVGTLSPVYRGVAKIINVSVVCLLNLSLSFLRLNLSSLLAINSTPRMLVQLTEAFVLSKLSGVRLLSLATNQTPCL